MFFMTPGDRLVGNHQVRQGGKVERPFGGGAVFARKPAKRWGRPGWPLIHRSTHEKAYWRFTPKSQGPNLWLDCTQDSSLCMSHMSASVSALRAAKALPHSSSARGRSGSAAAGGSRLNILNIYIIMPQKCCYVLSVIPCAETCSGTSSEAGSGTLQNLLRNLRTLLGTCSET